MLLLTSVHYVLLAQTLDGEGFQRLTPQLNLGEGGRESVAKECQLFLSRFVIASHAKFATIQHLAIQA